MMRAGWYVVAVMASVGVAELQRHASRIVNQVRSGETEYQVLSHGMPTGVVIARQAERPGAAPGATLEELLASPYMRGPRMNPETEAAFLRFVEDGRDAVGVVGDAK
jgi:prevent-host-death family protein